MNLVGSSLLKARKLFSKTLLDPRNILFAHLQDRPELYLGQYKNEGRLSEVKRRARTHP